MSETKKPKQRQGDAVSERTSSLRLVREVKPAAPTPQQAARDCRLVQDMQQFADCLDAEIQRILRM